LNRYQEIDVTSLVVTLSREESRIDFELVTHRSTDIGGTFLILLEKAGPRRPIMAGELRVRPPQEFLQLQCGNLPVNQIDPVRAACSERNRYVSRRENSDARARYFCASLISDQRK